MDAIPPDERTEERVACEREAVKPVIEPYPQGSLLVQRGKPITEAQYTLLEVESDVFLNSRSLAEQISRGVALFLLLTLLSMTGGDLRRALPAQSGPKPAQGGRRLRPGDG